MIIRAARPGDALRIATVHVEAWRIAYRGIVPDHFLNSLSIEERAARWRKDLEAGHPLTWIAELGDSGTKLGWISAGASRDEDATPPTGEIWAVYIDPDNWGKGVGRALCHTAEQELRRRGFTQVTLWVLEQNERALRFYQSNGFVRDECKYRLSSRGGRELREVRLRKQFSEPDVAAGYSVT